MVRVLKAILHESNELWPITVVLVLLCLATLIWNNPFKTRPVNTYVWLIWTQLLLVAGIFIVSYAARFDQEHGIQSPKWAEWAVLMLYLGQWPLGIYCMYKLGDRVWYGMSAWVLQLWIGCWFGAMAAELMTGIPL